MTLIFSLNSHQRHLFHIIPGSSLWPFITPFLVLFIDIISRIWLAANSEIKETIEKAKKSIPYIIFSIDSTVWELEKSVTNIKEILKSYKKIEKKFL